MSNQQTFSDFWNNLEDDTSYNIEKSILEFTLQLHQLMKERKISRKDLAESIGSSQAYITKVFKGKANFTISSMVKLANALNGKVTIHVTGKEEHNQKWFRLIDGNKTPIPHWKPKGLIADDITSFHPLEKIA